MTASLLASEQSSGLHDIIYIYIDMVTPHPPPPKIYTRLFHRIPQVASLHWSTTLYAENTVNTDTIVLANRAATSRGFDMCINLAPNLGRRFMIVYVLGKLKCWRAFYFCSCSTKKPRVVCLL